MENYEKKYKEALEKARQLCTYPTTKPFLSDLQDLFPELTESEDEKILVIIKHCIESRYLHTSTIQGISLKQCFAWLERQGEHANFRNKIQVGDKVTRNEAGVLVNLSQLNRVAKKDEKQDDKIDFANKEYWRGYREGKKLILDKYAEIEKQGQVKESTISQHENRICEENGNSLTSEDEKIRKALIGELNTYFDKDTKIDGFSIERIIAWLEKQGEQKPNPILDIEIPFGAKDSELQEATYYIPKGFHAEVDDDKVVIKQGKQKPAWSVEDEKMLHDAIGAVAAADYYTYDDKQEIEDWLKSLKNRVQSQPKQEWKQENTCDLTAFENAMMHIGGSFFGQHAGLDPNDTNSIKEQANLLLELVPSKEWSEEDEEILRTILSDGIRGAELDMLQVNWLKSIKRRVQPKPMCKFGDTELTQEELCEGLIRGMVNEHNRVTKEVLRNEYEKGRADVLAKIDAIDVDEMVCESGATSRVTQYWYAHGVNDVIKKLKEEQV